MSTLVFCCSRGRVKVSQVRPLNCWVLEGDVIICMNFPWRARQSYGKMFAVAVRYIICMVIGSVVYYRKKRRQKMTDRVTAAQEIEAFLQSWQGENQPMREWFRQFYRQLSSMEGVSLTFVARPGVSYSIRPVHVNQTSRDKFAIVDVIDDDPDERWLSVCFYEDMITDPNGRGELDPGRPVRQRWLLF